MAFLRDWSWPLLFKIYMYDLSSTISRNFAYADDLELLHFFVGSVVKWLKHHAHDQYDLGSKPTHAILLCP